MKLPDKFVRLAQANLDHYNNHPAAHNLMTVVAAGVAIVAITQIPKRIAHNDLKSRGINPHI